MLVGLFFSVTNVYLQLWKMCVNFETLVRAEICGDIDTSCHQ